MSNGSTNNDLPERNPDEPTESNREKPTGREPGDGTREKMAWALFALLTSYVLLHPFLPEFTPDPTIAGAIVTGLVSLLATRALGNGNGGGIA